MNKQEIFNTVREHLLGQLSKSLNNEGCAYRGLNKTKCAIGCLIDEEDYAPEMEHKNIKRLFRNHPVLRNKLKIDNESDIDFLQRLQGCHDSYPISMWSGVMKDIALDYGLVCES